MKRTTWVDRSGEDNHDSGKARFVVKMRDVTEVALRNVKKHEYLWTSDPKQSVKGGVLTHLSHSKPLKEKPKLVTLEFEKPLVVLEKKIAEVRRMTIETGMDFNEQIHSLRSKYQQGISRKGCLLRP